MLPNSPEGWQIPSVGPGRVERGHALLERWLRDVLSRSDSDSKCDAAVTVETFFHIPHVTNSPLGRRCIQVVHVVPSSEGSAPLQLWRWRRRFPAGRTAPGSGDT